MVWVIFVAGAVLSWGAYGVLLHQGQMMLASPLSPMLFVGFVLAAAGAALVLYYRPTA
jgi:hypothetical protein